MLRDIHEPIFEKIGEIIPRHRRRPSGGVNLDELAAFAAELKPQHLGSDSEPRGTESKEK